MQTSLKKQRVNKQRERRMAIKNVVQMKLKWVASLYTYAARSILVWLPGKTVSEKRAATERLETTSSAIARLCDRVWAFGPLAACFSHSSVTLAFCQRRERRATFVSSSTYICTCYYTVFYYFCLLLNWHSKQRASYSQDYRDLGQ